LALWELPVSTKDGEFIAGYSHKGLASLSFPNRKPRIGEARKFRGGRRHGLVPPGPPPAELRRWHAITAKALKEVLAGRAAQRLPPLDLSSGTDFQQRVWAVLRGIVPGKTLSYAQVAAAIGKPRAVRAVGGACGANPIAVLIPCHRVVASGGGLGGFGGGLEWKRRLLEREGSLPAQPAFVTGSIHCRTV
jgi:O-6-methylguanine DNA methyltransferase